MKFGGKKNRRRMDVHGVGKKALQKEGIGYGKVTYLRVLVYTCLQIRLKS